MTDKYKDDAMLEQYLDGNSELSKEYKEHEKQQPSSELDNLIISAAKDAIDTTTKKPKGIKSNWLIPTAVAATVVLSFSIIQLQKPTGLFQEEKTAELDIAAASIAEKPAPAKRVLEKKKERHKVDSFSPVEEEISPQQLADAEELPASAPLASEPPAMAIAGLMSKSSSNLASRQEVKKQRMANNDGNILNKDDWLNKIKALLKEKKLDEAKKEYQRFSAAHPDFEPDDELKQQLGLK